MVHGFIGFMEPYPSPAMSFSWWIVSTFYTSVWHAPSLLIMPGSHFFFTYLLFLQPKHSCYSLPTLFLSIYQDLEQGIAVPKKPLLRQQKALLCHLLQMTCDKIVFISCMSVLGLDCLLFSASYFCFPNYSNLLEEETSLSLGMPNIVLRSTAQLVLVIEIHIHLKSPQNLIHFYKYLCS